MDPISTMLVVKKSGYRFVDIDLSQIGSLIFLDLLLKEDVLKHQTPRHKILVLASYFEDGNRYMVDLYKDRVTFIRNPFLKFLGSPFFISHLFREDSHYRYDTVFFTENVSHKIWNEYSEKIGAPLVSMSADDIEKSRQQLMPYIGDKKFVALHVRDSGFYGDPQRTTRNSDINTYQKAVEHLIASGYAVVRMGDVSADPIDRMLRECGPDFFDYAHSPIKSEMLDCYLISQGEFFVGGPSGPSSTPMIFNRNSCNLNWNNITNGPNFLTGDITAFKKPRYKKDNQLVPFPRLLEKPFILSVSQKMLDLQEAYLENNTPDEILETLKEFLEGPGRPLTSAQLKAASFYNEKHYAFGAKGKLADVILRQYFPDNATQA